MIEQVERRIKKAGTYPDRLIQICFTDAELAGGRMVETISRTHLHIMVSRILRCLAPGAHIPDRPLPLRMGGGCGSSGFLPLIRLQQVTEVKGFCRCNYISKTLI